LNAGAAGVGAGGDEARGGAIELDWQPASKTSTPASLCFDLANEQYPGAQR
jgi:hypothetical protein